MNFHNRDLFQAIAASDTGDHHRALELFKRALEQDPENALAHAHASHCLFKMGRQFAAAQEADLAVAADPDLPLAHIVKALTDAVLDDDASAALSLNEALRLDPENETALKIRCAIDLSNRDLRELGRAVETLLSVAPDDDEAHFFASRLASMKLDAQKAEFHAREALNIDPNSAANHAAIGWAFWAGKDFETAKSAALSALSLDPNLTSAHQLLAAVEMHQAPLSGWFNRLGFIADSFDIKTVAKYLIPGLFLFMSANSLLDFFGFHGASDLLTWTVQGAALMLLLSTQLYARKASKNLQAAVLRVDY